MTLRNKAVAVAAKTATEPGGGGRKPGKYGSYRQKNKDILEVLQRAVHEKFGIERWHPLVEMAIYAADPDRAIVLRDDDGEICYDKNDMPIILERIDPMLRQRCLETLAKYVAPQLKSIELTPAAMGERFTLNYSLSVDGKQVGQEEDGE